MSAVAFLGQQSITPNFCLRPLTFGEGDRAAEPSRATALPIDPAVKVTGPEMVRQLLAAGWDGEARALLRQLLIIMPENDEPWLQLLSLEPSLRDDRAFLEEFLRHHPQHRFARAIGARLEQLQVVALLGDVRVPQSAAPRSTGALPRLGEYLIAHGWTTGQQVEDALAEQQRLLAQRVTQRLGTTLLMCQYVTVSQLARALEPTVSAPSPQLGNFLVRNNVLRAGDVAEMLAHQSRLGADADRRFLEAMAGRATLRPHGQLLRRLPTPRRLPPRIGQLLVAHGLISETRLLDVLREHDYNVRNQGGR